MNTKTKVAMLQLEIAASSGDHCLFTIATRGVMDAVCVEYRQRMKERERKAIAEQERRYLRTKD